MKVLVAIDQSDFRLQIIDALKKKHWPENCEFKIVSVIEPLPFHWEQLEFEEWEKTAQKILDKRIKVTSEILLSASKELKQSLKFNVPVETELRYGKALDEIVYLAAKWEADKLIIGAHGHQPNRLLASGVSFSIPHHAECSVELIRLRPLTNAPTNPSAHSVFAPR